MALWSVRMRAEGRKGEHVSGAEGIYKEAEVAAAAARYIERARSHPRGAALHVTVTVEPIPGRPRKLPPLKVSTLDTHTPKEARASASGMLRDLGVSEAAISAAFGVLGAPGRMRGAALIDAGTGRRLEPDQGRGVRASRIGAGPSIGPALGELDTPTVREALVLATKVASAPGVIAELCASDDPDYTTGYLASRRFGYVRLLNIKRLRSRRGGRVVFVRPGADVEKLIAYLELRPVLVG